MTVERLLVVGNGMAGLRLLEEIIQCQPDRYAITVVGAEAEAAYNRIQLSPVLAGDKTIEQIRLRDASWYADNGITLHLGDPVTEIDLSGKTARCLSGRQLHWDKLVFATGSEPFIIPVPGKDLPGVVSFRDINDVNTMLTASNTAKRAIVIGGGLLGLEAANGLLKRGLDVTVVHLMDRILERQLDNEASNLLRRNLEARGLKFELEASTECLLGDKAVTGLKLADGSELAADLVVMAVGIRPNARLANDNGVACERGVLVDDTMATAHAGVYALGECAQHRGQCYGLVAPLYEQAKVLAAQLCDEVDSQYVGSAVATTLKVSGVDLYSAGQIEGTANSETVVLRDHALGVYKRLEIEDDRLVGAVMYGEVADGPWLFELIREQAKLGPARERLLFGRALAEPKLAA